MNVAALFLKAPVLGTVKTRLAKSLGDEAALVAYRQLVEFLLKKIGESFAHIHFTPGDPETLKAWLGNGYSYTPQEGAGLGERLLHAMELEFIVGAEKLIFLGGDCPYVDQARIDEAFQQLDHYDVVIGPATDGGYYLIGMKRIMPELFTDVAWGTHSVFERTLKICQKFGYTVALLPEESDVDDLEAWEKAKAFMEVK
ncbi:MAG: TIGR04282 family arsenosugar biosynthesis glycosyltransferase [Verrucomicrobia bacterium]|nr:TIGR04282 family arsenosugar biosynthesis glycosyltransferase [Verrucomicrobiota bacterium]MDA1064985.1 TIGR04282 family arsenosugar biosynthesis glycosyltransferase [Verrucomicrobiota bacterium]